MFTMIRNSGGFFGSSFFSGFTSGATTAGDESRMRTTFSIGGPSGVRSRPAIHHSDAPPSTSITVNVATTARAAAGPLVVRDDLLGGTVNELSRPAKTSPAGLAATATRADGAGAADSTR